jgi:hypothetical protein
VRSYTWRIEDPADDPEALAEGIAELERRCGCTIACDALDGRLRRQRRDQLLRQCHAIMPGGSSWARCLCLAQEIERFERRWPALRDRGAPPEACSALRSYLFRARRLGPLPTSPRQLHTIVSLKRRGAGHFNTRHD